MKITPKTGAEKVMHAALKEIAQGYISISKMEKDAESVGLDYIEYLELIIEEMKRTAAYAIGVKPK